MFQPKTSHSNVFRHFNKTSYIHRPVIIFQAFVVYSQISFLCYKWSLSISCCRKLQINVDQTNFCFWDR